MLATQPLVSILRLHVVRTEFLYRRLPLLRITRDEEMLDVTIGAHLDLCCL